MARADTVNAPRGGKRIAARARAAIGYVRRSTDRQEQSIPDQKKAIEEYSDENDLRLLRFRAPNSCCHDCVRAHVVGVGTRDTHGIPARVTASM